MTHKIVEVTSVKPDNVEWFSDVYPEEFEGYLKWVRTLDGVMFLTSSKPDKNTLVRTYIFEDQDAADRYAEAHKTNPYAVLRQVYSDANGIIITYNLLDD
jgi:hypothetical protein